MDQADLDLGDYQELRANNGQPFRLNIGNNSHFIVKYDETLLNDILDHGELDNIAQLQLLQDLRLLAEGREINYATLVPLLQRFSNSHSAIVNAALYQIANSLKKFVIPGTALEDNLRQLFDQISKQQVMRLGWQPEARESNDDQLTRPYVLSASLYAKNSSSLKEAHELFNSVDKLAELPASVRPAVLQNEAENYGTPELFDRMISAYQKTADPGLKKDLCFAITKFTDPELLTKVVNEFENTKVIKPQDLRAWYRGVLANPAGQQLAWDWLRNEWDWLEATVGGDMEFATYITVTAGIFHTMDRLNEFKDFFTPKINTPGLTREINMDIRVITSRVDLADSEKASVNKAIESSIR